MHLSDETLRFIRQHARDDVRSLALHARPLPGVDLPAALTQIAGLQVLRTKVPTWAATEGILCPPRLSLEQCSSEATARYKARVVAAQEGSRRRLADLTGGLGIDCSFLAPLFAEADYVERQENLCRLAAHNLPLLGLTHVRVHCADGTGFLDTMPPADWLFLDPARRDSHGGRTVALADCEPDVSLLEDRLLDKAPRILLKLSPMLDLTLALHTLHSVREAHVVAVDNECKELLLILERGCTAEIDDLPVSCANLDATGEAGRVFTFTRRHEQAATCPLADAPLAWLYEPNAALLKAESRRLPLPGRRLRGGETASQQPPLHVRPPRTGFSRPHVPHRGLVWFRQERNQVIAGRHRTSQPERAQLSGHRGRPAPTVAPARRRRHVSLRHHPGRREKGTDPGKEK